VLSWIKKLFGHAVGMNNGLGLVRVDLRSNHKIQLQQQGTQPILDENDEKTAHQRVVASHQKDRDLIKQIGRRLNAVGGLDKKKLICCRSDNNRGNTRWIEMIWSGVGPWVG